MTGWWLKVAFLTDTMAIVNETLTRLQGDQNKIVTKMSIVFSQEEKFSMYSEELSNNDFSSFSSVQSHFEENPDERKEMFLL